MSDFRQTFYDNYVSKFKGTKSQAGSGSLLSFFAWSEYKFAPLFEDLGQDSAILELGCGPGYMLEFLKRRGFKQVRGIDISAEQVEAAGNRGCEAEVADVFTYLNGKSDTFDAIVALDFLEHFHKEELMVLMQCIFTSLKNGGRLILQTPNGEGLFPRQIIYSDLTHLTIFTPDSLRQLLAMAGFDDFGFYETGPAPINIKSRLRLFAWKLIKAVANTVRRIETGKSQSVWTENIICCCRKPVRQTTHGGQGI